MIDFIIFVAPAILPLIGMWFGGFLYGLSLRPKPGKYSSLAGHIIKTTKS